jgi:5-hydroxyisourate hydrolase-like protein (transthyretin family)
LFKKQLRKSYVFGFVLLLFLVFSSYWSFVQVVNAIACKDLVESLVLLSNRNGLVECKEFQISDVLVVSARVRHGNVYFLSFYNQGSLILSTSGMINGCEVEVRVPLYPPKFKANQNYVALFEVQDNDYILPGIFISSKPEKALFSISSTSANLSLESTYDQTTHELRLNATILNDLKQPIANRTINFYLQFNGRQRLTNGWLPIGSANSDSNGTATLSLALNAPPENYLVKATHKGDEDFGECESRVIPETSSALADETFNATQPKTCFMSSGGGNVTIEVSSYSPYAVLPMNSTARYINSTPLGPGLKVMLFYCDFTNQTGFLGLSVLSLVSESPLYIYEGSLVWSPSVVGFHKLIAGVVVGTITDIMKAMKNGTGIIAFGEANLDIQHCPSSMILHFPEAIYENILSVTVSFAKPRLYEEVDNDLFAAYTIAPKLVYNNLSYVIDEPVESIPVKLEVNGTQAATNLTNSDGVASLPLLLNFSDSHVTLSIKGVVSGPSLIYEGSTVEHVATFTRVSIRDVSIGGSSLFMFNCSVATHAQREKIYVGTENSVEVEARLFDTPLWDAPVSVLIGKPIRRNCTSALGYASIPVGSELLHVSRLYDIHLTTAYAAADITGLEGVPDGKVDLRDVSTVASAFGTFPGDAKWDWRADINFDLKVDIRDVSLCASNFGKKVNYSGIVDYSVVKAYFYTLNGLLEAYLDRWGCVYIPTGAYGLMLTFDDLPIGGVVEFFRSAFHQECHTSNVGLGRVGWIPTEIGFLNFSKTGFGLPPYFMLVRMPSRFQVSVAMWSNVTNVKAMVSLVSFLEVVKRPLDLSVEYTPSNPTLDDEVTMIANVFDIGLEVPAEGLKVEFYIYDWTNWVFMGDSYTNSSGVATFVWKPRDYLEQCHFADFVLLVRVNESICMEMAEVEGVHVDARLPTKLEFLGSEVMKVFVGSKYTLSFKLSSNGDPVSGRWIDLYINNNHSNFQTQSNGMASAEWVPQQADTYIFKARFCSWDPIYKPSNEVKFIRIAEVVPMSILLDVQPKEFKPGTELTLTAKVLNATSNDPLQGVTVTFYAVDVGGSKAWIGEDVTNIEGVAELNHIYHEAWGAHAFTVGVASGQHIITSPIMLTVAKETMLLMDVSKEKSSYNHTVSCRLFSYGMPVPYKQVKIYVNETLKGVFDTADPDGNFSLRLNLQPVNHKVTSYIVRALFEGDNPQNATFFAFTPNGTCYSVCTTIQYGFKPASNSTSLTVEPQATQIAMPKKTPKQLEEEARAKGRLKTEPKFSWWYPWFWLQTLVYYSEFDYRYTTCTSLFGGWLENYNGLENPLYKIFEGVSSEQVEMLTSVAIASITTATATFIGGYIAIKATEWTLPAYLAALIVYGMVSAAAISILYYYLDAYIARAALITVGWTLLALSTLGFTRTIPIFASRIMREDPVKASIKCIINTLLGVAISTAILKTLGVSILTTPFYLITFALGLTALSLGYTKI